MTFNDLEAEGHLRLLIVTLIKGRYNLPLMFRDKVQSLADTVSS